MTEADWASALVGHDQAQFKVPVKREFVRFTPTSEPLPNLSVVEQEQVARWINRDAAYLDQQQREQQRLSKSLEQPGSALDVFGWPQSRSTSAFSLKPSGLGMDGVRPNNKLAEEEESLVAIRLDLDTEKVTLRDTFTWNAKDQWTSPELFATHLVNDMQLPARSHPAVKREIIQAITDQLTDSRALAWETHVYLSARDTKDDFEDDTDKSFLPEELTQAIEKNEELRIRIHIDVTLDNINLTDCVEWDLSNPRNSPEEFAQALALDLGLPGEFITAVAHIVREQVDAYTRSLGLIEHHPGQAISNEELRPAFLPPVASTSAAPYPHGDITPLFRPKQLVADYTPRLDAIPPEELDRRKKLYERETRRKKRSTRGRQRINLPDREPVATSRTLPPRPGGKPPVVTEKDDEFFVGSFDIARPYKKQERPDLMYAGWTADEIAQERERRKKPRYAVEHLSDDEQAPSKKASHAQIVAATSIGGTGSLIPPRAGTPDLTLGQKKKTGAPRGRPRKNTIPPPPPPEAINQHANFIGGVWHCTNCGGPEGVVFGKRKGPAGEKTLCSDCGQYYRRFRKNRPCVYTTDPEQHRQLIQAEQEAARIAAETNRSVSGPKSRTRLLSPLSDITQDSDDEYPPKRSNRKRKNSDSSFTSQSSGAPLSRQAPPPAHPAERGSPARGTAKVEQRVTPPALSRSQSQSNGAAPSRSVARPPEWMLTAAGLLRTSKPEDRFEIILRPLKVGAPPPPPEAEPEWRIRCMDCPGKLYTTGPGESLDNFDVHLRNKQHRQNVEVRLAKG